MHGLLLTLLLAAAAPRPGPQPVVTAAGNQLQPSACRLHNGVALLAFERLQSVFQRAVYVKRRRPGFGWSYGRALPTVSRDYAQRHPSLLCRPRGLVFLYVQVGDLRRRRGAVRLYRAAGDSLRFTDQGRLSLGLPRGAAVTEPFAATTSGGGVLLTVSLRHAGQRSGCWLARSRDGVRFTPARRTGPGQRCRTVSLSGRRWLQTYQHRSRRGRPFRGWLRLSSDGGRTWSPPRPVGRLRESFDVHPVVEAGGQVTLFHVARLGRRSAVFATRLAPGGARGVTTRRTALSRRRDLHPAALVGPRGLTLFFAREVKPLDFDVLALPPAPRGRVSPRKPSPRQR